MYIGLKIDGGYNEFYISYTFLDDENKDRFKALYNTRGIVLDLDNINLFYKYIIFSSHVDGIDDILRGWVNDVIEYGYIKFAKNLEDAKKIIYDDQFIEEEYDDVEEIDKFYNKTLKNFKIKEYEGEGEGDDDDEQDEFKFISQEDHVDVRWNVFYIIPIRRNDFDKFVEQHFKRMFLRDRIPEDVEEKYFRSGYW